MKVEKTGITIWYAVTDDEGIEYTVEYEQSVGLGTLGEYTVYTGANDVETDWEIINRITDEINKLEADNKEK